MENVCNSAITVKKWVQWDEYLCRRPINVPNVQLADRWLVGWWERDHPLYVRTLGSIHRHPCQPGLLGSVPSMQCLKQSRRLQNDAGYKSNMRPTASLCHSWTGNRILRILNCSEKSPWVTCPNCSLYYCLHSRSLGCPCVDNEVKTFTMWPSVLCWLSDESWKKCPNIGHALPKSFTNTFWKVTSG